jgi:hypothetical protein
MLYIPIQLKSNKKKSPSSTIISDPFSGRALNFLPRDKNSYQQKITACFFFTPRRGSFSASLQQLEARQGLVGFDRRTKFKSGHLHASNKSLD